MIENAILIAVIVIVIGAASFYIYKEKKKGVKCVGCPYAKECAKKNCGSSHTEGFDR